MVPLSDFHTYMPDMIDLMASGITSGKKKVKDALEGMTGEMSVIAKANVVSKATGRGATGGTTGGRTVTQNVNINNQFNGDRAGQQKRVLRLWIRPQAMLPARWPVRWHLQSR